MKMTLTALVLAAVLLLVSACAYPAAEVLPVNGAAFGVPPAVPDASDVPRSIFDDPDFNIANSPEGQLTLLLYALQDVAPKGEKYADFYAGAYYENNELIVLVTELTPEIEAFIAASSRNKDIKIRLAGTSLNELYRKQESITKLCIQYADDKAELKTSEELNDLLKSIVSIGIDEKNNRVHVRMNKINGEKKAAFKKYFDSSDSIIFIESEHFSFAMNMMGGPINTFMGGYSVGYRCIRMTSAGYRKGFVTAGHGMINGMGVYWDYLTPIGGGLGTLIGTVNGIVFGNYQYDACFVSLNNQSNEIYDKGFWKSDVIAQNYFVSAPGGYITKQGRTTRDTTGLIISWSEDVPVGGILVIDCAIVSVYSLGGDSGGLAYAYINGDNCLVGILSSSNSAAQPNSLSAFTKAKNLYSALDLYAY